MRLGPLLALAVATFALGFGELLIAGILPDMARDLHVSLASTGALVGAYAATFALTSLPLAIVVTRFERRTALVAALLLVTVANALAAVGGTFAVVLAMRIVAAVGSAVATTIALAAVDSLADVDARGRAHGIVFAGFSAAATLGVPTGVVIAAGLSWRYAFGGVALCALVAALLIAFVMPRVPRGVPPAWPDLVRAIAQPRLRLTIALSLISLCGEYVVFIYIRPIIAAGAGFAAPTVAALLFLYGAVGIAGNVGGGSLVDRIGAQRTILVCLAGGVAVFLVFDIALRTLPGAIAIVALWSLTSWGFSPAVNHLVSASTRATPEIGLALNVSAFNVGIALGSFVGGIVVATTTPLALPLTGAAILAVTLGLAARYAVA